MRTVGPEATLVANAVEGLIVDLARRRRPGSDPEPAMISTYQGVMLATLVDHGPTRLGSLADALGTTDATASRNVDVLQSHGLAERRADPADRRAVLVVATRAGAAHVRRRRRQLARLAERAIAGLSPHEAARLTRVLAELRTLLAAADDDEAPVAAAAAGAARRPPSL